MHRVSFGRGQVPACCSLLEVDGARACSRAAAVHDPPLRGRELHQSSSERAPESADAESPSDKDGGVWGRSTRILTPCVSRSAAAAGLTSQPQVDILSKIEFD